MIMGNLKFISNKLRLCEINLIYLLINIKMLNCLYPDKKKFKNYLTKIFSKLLSWIKLSSQTKLLFLKRFQAVYKSLTQI